MRDVGLNTKYDEWARLNKTCNIWTMILCRTINYYREHLCISMLRGIFLNNWVNISSWGDSSWLGPVWGKILRRLREHLLFEAVCFLWVWHDHKMKCHNRASNFQWSSEVYSYTGLSDSSSWTIWSLHLNAKPQPSMLDCRC